LDSQLISLDTPAQVAKVTTPTTQVNNFLDLDSLVTLGTPVKITPEITAPVTNTTVPTSKQTTTVSAPTEEKQHKHKHKHKHRSEPAKETSTSTQSPTTAIINTAPVQGKLNLPTVPKLKTLVQDSNILIVYEIQLSVLQTNQAVVQLQIKNLLTNGTIQNFEFNILSSLNTKLLQPSPITPQIALSPQQTAILPLTFTLNSFSQLQKLKGSVTFTVQNVGQKLDFVIVLPSSAFIVPVKLSLENFTNLLKGPDCTFLQSTKTKTKDFQSVSSLLSTLLHVAPIELINTTATFYGKTIQDHHVAIYIKEVNDNFIQVDLKCSDAALASSLISEITTVLL